MISGTINTIFSIGDKYWCIDPFLSEAKLGVIIALTNAPGKMIGLQFDEIINGHTCDGNGAHGRCLWVSTAMIYDESEWNIIKEQLNIQSKVRQVYHNLKQITIDEDIDNLKSVGTMMPSMKE